MSSLRATGLLTIACLAAALSTNCDPPPAPMTDQKVQAKQDQALEQALAEVGMPAIVNWQELRMAKQLYELRDKAIATYAYLPIDSLACLLYLGEAVGYGLPYATQYSSPSKWTRVAEPPLLSGATTYSWQMMPQAEPNGLFMPTAAEGTWVQLKDPESNEVKPVYLEPRIVVSPFRIRRVECPPGAGRPADIKR